MKALLPLLAVFALVGLSPVAKADTIKTFTLNLSDGNGTGPFGTVTLTQASGNTTDVVVNLTLASGIVFANTGAGESITFNFSGAAATISNISPTGFVNSGSVLAGPGNPSWGYSVTCTSPTCQGGNPGNSAGPLEFTVSRASGLSVNDFGTSNISSGGQIYPAFFSSDIRTATGATFVVWTGDGTIRINEVPEPMTMSLLGLGLAGMGLLKRARRK